MRRLIDEGAEELRSILDLLMRQDVDITVREVARRHSQLKNASAFTRNPERMAAISAAQKKQAEARGHGARGALSAARLAEERKARIDELEAQVRALVASHAACIRAVMLHGGTAGLERFWTDYKSIADTVREVGGMPPAADVVKLKPK